MLNLDQRYPNFSVGLVKKNCSAPCTKFLSRFGVEPKNVYFLKLPDNAGQGAKYNTLNRKTHKVLLSFWVFFNITIAMALMMILLKII